VGWDEIDDLVVAARLHFGPEGGPILGDGATIQDEGLGSGLSAHRRVS
jgi:hypothetical protein